MVRTHPGIQRRLLVAFTLLAIVPAAAVSFLATGAVGRAIEARLVRERVQSAARVISEMHLPLSTQMMTRLKQFLGPEEAVAAELRPDAIGEEMVSSLPPDQLRAFAEQLRGRGTLPKTIRLEGHDYVLASAEIKDIANQTRTLYLLVDQHVLKDAKADAVRPILWGTIPILVVSLAAAIYISRTITQPIRRLSSQIESQVAGGAGAEPSPLTTREVDLDAPRELAELALAFNRMLWRLRDAQRRVLDAERLAAVGKIAASVAHEVRNPLAGIRMNLQLLAGHLEKSGRSDESLTIAIAELDRLDSIVQEMLILGRKAEPKLAEVDLREVAQDVLALLDRRLRHGGIEVKFEGTAAPALADAGQVKQVLLNLVLNAADAMPQGGTLTVRTLSRDGWSRVEIDDTGGGLEMSAGQDPFAWFSSTKSAGGGVGLAVCKQIVEAHGGRIGLERLERGTRGWVELKQAGGRMTK